MGRKIIDMGEIGMEYKYNYKVVEDNGGGMTLFVFWGRKPIYCHTGYEFIRHQLSNDLDALDAGTNLAEWEGGEDDPQGAWNSLFRADWYCGNRIVVEGGGGKRKLHKGLMGRAAMLEFGVTDEERDTAQRMTRLGETRSIRKAAAVRENGKKGGRPRKST